MSFDDLLSEALIELSGVPLRLEEAKTRLPAGPGLYAVVISAAGHAQLGLPSAVGRAAYVGKAERSLRSRDLNTHFAEGRTGQSTLRRSLAALLAQRCGLRARPRNPARRDGSPNFGLEPGSEQCLQEWVEEHARIRGWACPPTDVSLRRLERGVIAAWAPPLNLDGANPRWGTLWDARAAMAAESRAWTPPAAEASDDEAG